MKAVRKSDKIQDQSGELKAQLARALADYDNLVKRTENEKVIWVKFATQGVLTKVLPVLDTLEKAQVHLKDQGLEMATLELKKVLYEEGLEEIAPKEGEVFDHDIHEAVESVQGGEKGKIASLILSGWKFSDGAVIRHARVRVFEG